MSSRQEPSQPTAFSSFVVLALLLSSVIASAEPFITLSKRSGPPTTLILVSGRGFEPNVGVDIFFDTKDKALVVTNANGEFDDARIYAPRSARPGEHWVTALERNNDKGAQKSFLVQTNWSLFHFDADGTRLNPYENVLNPSTVVDLELRWKYQMEILDSEPAVVNGVVYAGDCNYVFAFDAKTGAKVWRHFALGCFYGTPAVVDGVVYIGSTLGSFYALDANTGRQLWSYTTTNAYLTAANVNDGVAYIGSNGANGTVYALDAKTGTELWERSFSGPVTDLAVADGVLYLGSYNHFVYAVDASTGRVLWESITGDAVQASPTTANGLVYVGSNDGKVYALSASTGSVIWAYYTGGGVDSSPAVADGIVYVGSKDYNIYALDALTGTKLWNYHTGYWVTSSPALGNGVVYVGSMDWNVDALDARTGALLWVYSTQNPVTSSPIVADGAVYIGSGDFYLYAFGLGKVALNNPGSAGLLGMDY